MKFYRRYLAPFRAALHITAQEGMPDQTGCCSSIRRISMSQRRANVSQANTTVLSSALEFDAIIVRQRRPSATDFARWACVVSPVYRAEPDRRLRGHPARLLLQCYGGFGTVLFHAWLNRNGLPEVPGSGWNPHSALAGVPSDVFRFEDRDRWITAPPTPVPPPDVPWYRRIRPPERFTPEPPPSAALSAKSADTLLRITSRLALAANLIRPHGVFSQA